MIYGATPETDTSPTLQIEPDERLGIAEIAELDRSIDPIVIERLKRIVGRDGRAIDTPARFEGIDAVKLRTVVGEAATGTVFSGHQERVEVKPELRRFAQGLLGLSDQEHAPAAGQAKAVPVAESTASNAELVDTSPSASDKLILGVLGRLKRLTGFHSGYIPRQFDKDATQASDTPWYEDLPAGHPSAPIPSLEGRPVTSASEIMELYRSAGRTPQQDEFPPEVWEQLEQWRQSEDGALADARGKKT